jgi:tRNA nucleotidyltransferase (CCA-adding enzyme)
MQNRLSKDSILLLQNAGVLAEEMGMKCYLVGGSVRDLLLNTQVYDIDLTIEGDGLKFAGQFRQRYGKRIRLFHKFGTAFVVVNDGRRIDISTSRTEVYVRPGSLPDVKYGNIESDLYRRDFTINSMAIELIPNRFGLLHSYHNGINDLEKGIIRVLNDDSFSDDPLRILRAIRFEQRFGFTIESHTETLLLKSIASQNLRTVSVERVRTELVVSTGKGKAASFFARLNELGVLKQLNENLVFEREKRRHSEEVNRIIDWFTVEFPQERIEKWIPHHLVLFSGLKGDIQVKVIKGLKYPRSFLDRILRTIYFLDEELKRIDVNTSDGELAIILAGFTAEEIIYLMAVLEKGDATDKLNRFLTYSRFVKPELNGNDLINIGILDGIVIGKLLLELKREKINGALPSRESELDYVRSANLRPHNE